MNTIYQHKKIVAKGFMLSLLTLGLIACGDNNDNDNDDGTTTPEVVTQQFEVTVTNLTAGQPFSPIAVIAHTSEYSVFTLGESSTVGLETLAEGGDNSALITEAEASDAVSMTLSAEGPLPPGGIETLSFSIDETELEGLQVSAVTMLVNTNDAITAIQGISLENMEVDDVVSFNTIGYDSGTEANSELTGTIPGPAVGGEGFNAARDDIADEVRMHSGVITLDDGLSTSRLTQVHRWDNPVSRISITRTE